MSKVLASLLLLGLAAALSPSTHAADAKVAHVSLHLDAAHPSFIELPLAP